MSNTVSAMWSWWWHAVDQKHDGSRATLTAFLSILAVFWFLRAIMKSTKVVPLLPPGPRGLPLVGYLPFLGTELHRKFEELAISYGPIYKLWLGKKLCVVVSSPSLVKEVVRDQDRVFANRDPPIAGLVATYGGADIVFAPYGDDWKKLRKIFVREMLSGANLCSSQSLLREEVKKSIRNVYEKSGSPIDIGELAFLTVINSTINMLWGGTLRGEEGAAVGAQFKSVLAELMVLLGKPNVSDFFPVLARFDLQGIERQAKRNSMWIESILDSVIEKRMNMAKEEKEGVEERKDFLQILLEIRDHHGDAAKSISMNQIKALLLVCPILFLLCAPSNDQESYVHIFN
jgi:cytochrome P450